MISLNLNAINFARHEPTIASTGNLTAAAFMYASGVKALRINNGVGEIILLPFHGQQIWDATFFGRRLTMRSMFDEPVDTSDYLGNYGGFLLHCGAMAMGNPGVGDTHSLHGELPNARYQSAELLIGQDSDGDYMELTGHYRHTIAFAANYSARPRLRIYAGSARMKMSLEITNLKNSPMELMYLAHVNFRPIDGAMILDTVKPGAERARVRAKVPEFFKPSAAHTAMIAAVQANPDLHRQMTAGQAIDPELVMGLDFAADAEGWAHSVQLLPDGSADFISHRPDELSRGVRWITRTADQDALGLFLPGTAEADGYGAEKKKGNVLLLPSGETFKCSLVFGALTENEAVAYQKKCRKV